MKDRRYTVKERIASWVIWDNLKKRQKSQFKYYSEKFAQKTADTLNKEHEKEKDER